MAAHDSHGAGRVQNLHPEPCAPTPPRNGVAGGPSGPEDGDLDDRLIELLARGQNRQERLLSEIGGKLDKQVDALAELKVEIAALRVTPQLIRLMVVGMFLVVVLVGMASAAQVAVETGWFKVETAPAP